MRTPPKILEKKLLSDNWYKLYKYTFEITGKTGAKHEQVREAYDRGNGAVILLYNIESKNIILTRQFRLPTFVNGNPDGMMIESPRKNQRPHPAAHAPERTMFSENNCATRSGAWAAGCGR